MKILIALLLTLGTTTTFLGLIFGPALARLHDLETDLEGIHE